MTSDITADYAVEDRVPARVEHPHSEEELSRVLKDAHRADEASIIWGGGSRMHVGNRPARYDLAVDITGLDQIVAYEPADLTVVTQAGVTIADLQSRLAESGQRLPFDPPAPVQATVGGSLASNAVGPSCSGFGAIRDHTLGLRVVEADGTITKSGGAVVKNVQGFDLVRLHVGALGTLGAISQAAFKVAPLPRETRTVLAWFDTLDGARRAAMEVFNGPFLPEAFVVLSGPRLLGALSEFPTFDGDASPRWYALAARSSGGHATVSRQIDDLTSVMGAQMANGFDVLDSEAGRALWRVACPPDATVSTRVALKPTAAFRYVSQLQQGLNDQPGDLDITLHAGVGTVLAHWRPEDPADHTVVDWARLTCAKARENGGLAVLERLPLDIKRDMDVWDDLGGALAVMRRMKDAFDPKGLLNPGRFAGRI